MTGVKEQYKLLKDLGKGVTEGFSKAAKEAVVLPEVKNLFKGMKSGSKKITEKLKNK